MFTLFTSIFSKKYNLVFALLKAFIIAVLMIAFSQFTVFLGIFKLFSPTEIVFWSSTFEIIVTSLAVMTPLQLSLFILLSLGFGINSVLFVVYVKHYKKNVIGAGNPLTFLGLLFGIFGAGCLSCSVILLAPLTSIFGIGTATWFAGHGTLVSFIGLLFVLYSIYLLLKKLNDPQVCEVITV
jgi:hypothetical protein